MFLCNTNYVVSNILVRDNNALLKPLGNRPCCSDIQNNYLFPCDEVIQK